MKCNENIPNAGFRFNRKAVNENERKVFQNYWKEITQLYGTYIDYFVYDYSLSAHDYFYGEQPLAPFRVPPKGFPILAEFQNDSLLLSKFGIQTEADVTFIIPIQTYYEMFGNGAEPKAGDVIRMSELGSDRPGGLHDINVSANAPLTACSDAANPLNELCRDGIVAMPAPNCSTDTSAYSAYDDPETFNRLLRGAPCFEITERRDENMTLHYNPLQGHYVWILHGKRFDYSYQPNAPREPGSMNPNDETRTGLISTDTGNMGYPSVSSLPLPEDIRLPAWGNNETESNKEWDYTKTPLSNDDVYGGY
jgi:hypothetical protein